MCFEAAASLLSHSEPSCDSPGGSASSRAAAIRGTGINDTGINGTGINGTGINGTTRLRSSAIQMHKAHLSKDVCVACISMFFSFLIPPDSREGVIAA